MSSELKLITPITLIGPMGSGKSTIGNYLNNNFNLPFIDLDDYIVKTNNMSIPKIFELYGQDHFRELEHKALMEALEQKIVISTGGGVVTNEKNHELLNSKSFCVYLFCDEQSQYQRTMHDTNRPMLMAENRYERVKQLFLQRAPLYEKCAHVTLNTSRGTPKQVCLDIIDKYKQLVLNM